MAGPVNLVEYYRDARGRCPYLDWRARLRDDKALEKLDRRVRSMEAGRFVDERRLGDGVVESRIHYGPGYRLYYAQQGETLYLLLCGGDKSTQRRDIARAKAYWQDHKRRVQA